MFFCYLHCGTHHAVICTVLPNVMESEDELNEYIKLRNIEGKVSVKKTISHEDFEQKKGDSIEENSLPIENNTEDEKLEFNNPNDVTASIEQKSHVDNVNKCDIKTTEIDKESKRKGILKYQRTYSNKHVDFNMDLEFVPFDENKDYTIEIQIVEQMPKKIVSYAALFAQQKKEEEEKLIKEAKEKEKQNIKRNKRRKYHEWKTNRKQDKQNNTPILKLEHNGDHLRDDSETHLSTEDEMDDEKDGLSESSSYSDIDKEHSDTSECLESERVMSVEDDTLPNQSQEQELECKTADDLNIILKDTEIEAEIEQKCQDNHTESTNLINERCKDPIFFKNNADNVQFFSGLRKKQRSNSLSGLDDIRKPHRFVMQRLARDMELIISKELENLYYQ